MREETFEAIGTHWSILLPDTLSEKKVTDALASIHERVARFDLDYSRFRSDSWIARIAKTPGLHTMPHDAQPLFDLYRDMYAQTDGAVTPLIGDVLIAAGYDAQYSLTPRDVRAPFTWDEALTYAYPKLTIKKKTTLDVGAAGKGYLVDIIVELLRSERVETFVVNAGGDIFVSDIHGVVVDVALEHPGNTAEAIGVAHIVNKSICGSAGNRRSWGTYTHIINPHTRTSPKDPLAVWVVADTALLADMLTTALFFVSPKALALRHAFDYLLVHPDYSIERSAGFPADLFFS